MYSLVVHMICYYTLLDWAIEVISLYLTSGTEHICWQVSKTGTKTPAKLRASN